MFQGKKTIYKYEKRELNEETFVRLLTIILHCDNSKLTTFRQFIHRNTFFSMTTHPWTEMNRETNFH